jgi:hypothetical protein
VRRTFFFAAAAFFFSLSMTSAARADDDVPPPWRIGATPFLGAGAALMTSSSQYPGFIAMSVLGAEIHYQSDRPGGFLRAYFMSSGEDGRWTAPGISLGGSYVLFGNGYDKLALQARGALAWERWHATTHGAGCAVKLFFPSQCPDYVAPPSGAGGPSQPDVLGTHVTTDTFGIVPALRLELPTKRVYVGLDLELAAMTSFSSDAPGTVFETRFAIVFGMRDRRDSSKPAIEEPTPRRRIRPGLQ